MVEAQEAVTGGTLPPLPSLGSHISTNKAPLMTCTSTHGAQMLLFTTDGTSTATVSKSDNVDTTTSSGVPPGSHQGLIALCLTLPERSFCLTSLHR